MAVKLIASDLDGTLLTNKKELSPRTREALDLAAAQGIYLCRQRADPLVLYLR